jgi:trimeric autotransporter adhesin
MPRLDQVSLERARPQPSTFVLRRFFLCLLALASWVHATGAQTVDTDLWVTNGDVRAIVQSGDNVYLGGNFSRVGPATGCGVPLDVSSAGVPSVFPKIAGSSATLAVNCVIPDGTGGWYIGGSFTSVGGFPRLNMAHIKSDLTVDQNFDPRPNSTVGAMALSGSVVYLAGDFTDLDGVLRNRLAAVDVATGDPTAWNPAPNGIVSALAVSGSVVYVGGAFTQIGGQPRLRIAAINGATGVATSWNPSADNEVHSLAVNGSIVFAGGLFITIGGQPRPYLAAIDALTGAATGWDPPCDNDVRFMVVGGSQLYIAGLFSQVGGASRNGLAALDVGASLVSSWDPNPDSRVLTIVPDGPTVWVGGTFESVGGEQFGNIAKLDASTGAALDWTPILDGPVNALARGGTRIYAGGSFRSVGGVARNNLAAFQISTGSVTSWNPNSNGIVQCMALRGDSVYVGGHFTVMGGSARNRIAAVHRITGLVTPFNPNANGSVYALTAHGVAIYAGGDFTTLGGVTRNRLAAIKLDSTLFPWNPNLNGTVRAILVNSPTIYVGGTFTTVGAATRNRAAAIDSTTGTATGWDPSPNGTIVYALGLMDNRIYIAGDFTVIELQSRNRLAALNPVSGLAYSWDPSPNGPVLCLAVTSSLVYFGGSFTQVAGQSRPSLAAFEIPAGVLKSWNPTTNRTVSAIAKQDSVVFVGGAFTAVGVSPQAQIAGIEAIPEVTSISNPIGGNGGAVTVDLRGTGFRFGATAKLVRTGFADIPGTTPVVAGNGRSLTTTFDLTGKAAGLWNAIVTNPGPMASSPSLLNLYLVQAVTGPQLTVSVVGPDSIRAGVSTPFDVVIENAGNVDAVAVPLWIIGIPSNATVGLGFTSSPPPQAGGEPSWSGVPATFTAGGAQYLPLVIPRVPPGVHTRRITLSVPVTSPLFQLGAAVAPSWSNDPVFLGCLQSGGVIANPSCVGTQLAGIESYLAANPQITTMSGTGIWAKVAWQCEGAGTLAAAIAKSEQILDHLDNSIEHGTAASGCQDAMLARWRQLMVVRVVSSIDPNDKLSPQGPVSAQQAIPYSIRFENLAVAGANTQKVIISDVITQNLDLSTFTLDAVSFGSYHLSPPPGTQQFSWDVDLGPTKGIVVRIVAGFTPFTPFDRTLVWSFTSLDRITLQPLDPTSLNGFLPPNVVPPEGEGSVLFTIKPSSQAANGTQITNAATISFDGTPLTTPAVSNSLDNQAPSSNVLALGTPIGDPSFPVSWQGSGPGLRDYTVYVSQDATPYQVWRLNTTTTSGTFQPQPGGHNYSFYSVARDMTGNIETAPSSPDAQTVSTTSVGGSGIASGLRLAGAQPNPAKGVLRIGFTLPSRDPATLELIDVAGRRVLRRAVGELGPGDHVLTLGSTPQLKSGLYFVRLVQGPIVLQSRVVWMR